MKALRPGHYVFAALSMSVALAACGAPAGQVDTAPSVAPDRVSSFSDNGDLLYVSGSMRHAYALFVLSYPSLQFLYKLTSVRVAAVDLCSDAGGNVFVPAPTSNEAGTVEEFAHGGRAPIASWNDPGSPVGCSVDPTTGDVAVANYFSPLFHHHGNIAVFTPGRGSPKLYHSKDIAAFAYCAYDGSGNLFADGVQEHTGRIVFAEFAAGSHRFREVTIDKPLMRLGPIQWDGKYFAIGYKKPNVVYRVAFSGSRGSVVGEVHLRRPHFLVESQFWIDADTIMVPFGPSKLRSRSVGFWRYPKGGQNIALIKKLPSATYLFGVTVSAARPR